MQVGINSNVNNIVFDINGYRNVAGAGVNLARRIMNPADGACDLFVSQEGVSRLRREAPELYHDAVRQAPAE